MTYVDLTADFCGRKAVAGITRREVALKSDRTRYTGVVYDLNTTTMMGSYIDFPGHIMETDDGVHGGNVDLADFCGMPAAVIHLDRAKINGIPGDVCFSRRRFTDSGIVCCSDFVHGFPLLFSIDPRAADSVICCAVRVLIFFCAAICVFIAFMTVYINRCSVPVFHCVPFAESCGFIRFFRFCAFGRFHCSASFLVLFGFT